MADWNTGMEDVEDMHLNDEVDSDTSFAASIAGSSTIFPSPTSRKRRSFPLPRPIHTPSSPMSSSIPHNLLPSAPASPPTPAPSPTPQQRVPDWSTAADHEDEQIRDVRALFAGMNDAAKQRLLAELLNMCNSQQLGFVQEFVSPRLKKDPFTNLPDELCLRVWSIWNRFYRALKLTIFFCRSSPLSTTRKHSPGHHRFLSAGESSLAMIWLGRRSAKSMHIAASRTSSASLLLRQEAPCIPRSLLRFCHMVSSASRQKTG